MDDLLLKFVLFLGFDELRCHCGTAVLYPPIHCGTKPPECSQPCTRSHPCDHEVKHSCHSDENCPPCTSLTTKWCYGKHKVNFFYIHTFIK